MRGRIGSQRNEKRRDYLRYEGASPFVLAQYSGTSGSVFLRYEGAGPLVLPKFSRTSGRVMPKISVAQFAGELKVAPKVLLEQLRAAGVNKALADDVLSE